MLVMGMPAMYGNFEDWFISGLVGALDMHSPRPVCVVCDLHLCCHSLNSALLDIGAVIQEEVYILLKNFEHLPCASSIVSAIHFFKTKSNVCLLQERQCIVYLLVQPVQPS